MGTKNEMKKVKKKQKHEIELRPFLGRGGNKTARRAIGRAGFICGERFDPGESTTRGKRARRTAVRCTTPITPRGMRLLCSKQLHGGKEDQ